MKIFRIELLILVFIFLAASFRPLPKASLKNSEIIKAKLIDIGESEGDFDIGLRLENDENFYYINRGLENGVNLEALQESLLNQEVEVFYIKHFTPIDPKQRSRHISRIKVGNQIVYDEIKS